MRKHYQDLKKTEKIEDSLLIWDCSINKLIIHSVRVNDGTSTSDKNLIHVAHPNTNLFLLTAKTKMRAPEISPNHLINDFSLQLSLGKLFIKEHPKESTTSQIRTAQKRQFSTIKAQVFTIQGKGIPFLCKLKCINQ